MFRCGFLATDVNAGDKCWSICFWQRRTPSKRGSIGGRYAEGEEDQKRMGNSYVPYHKVEQKTIRESIDGRNTAPSVYDLSSFLLHHQCDQFSASKRAAGCNEDPGRTTCSFRQKQILARLASVNLSCASGPQPRHRSITALYFRQHPGLQLLCHACFCSWVSGLSGAANCVEMSKVAASCLK